MVYGLLQELKELRENAGIPAGEEYPAGDRVAILSPVPILRQGFLCAFSARGSWGAGAASTRLPRRHRRSTGRA